MYRSSKKLKDIPQELRPREKLQRLGAENLSEEELLAVILGSGTKEMDVLSLAKALTEVGWKRLQSMTIEEVEKTFKGIGKVKACQIRAMIELSRRLRDPYGGISILSPEDAYRFLRDKVDNRREYLIALYLSPLGKLLEYQVIAIGRMNALFAEPREILYHAINLACHSILVAHNHPKGQLKPSKEDLEFTQRLKVACEIMGFELLDHIIVNSEGFVSLRREGYMG
ncbi:MAG: DNA repair protein RadC [Acidobacteria bacterium]|jgi:DNA repair protein RadC|nr:MAG: DNA repair protein RadC [Acidobacteriota bacterium]